LLLQTVIDLLQFQSSSAVAEARPDFPGFLRVHRRTLRLRYHHKRRRLREMLHSISYLAIVVIAVVVIAMRNQLYPISYNSSLPRSLH
jgi:hypothetical protein